MKIYIDAGCLYYYYGESQGAVRLKVNSNLIWEISRYCEDIVIVGQNWNVNYMTAIFQKIKTLDCSLNISFITYNELSQIDIIPEQRFFFTQNQKFGEKIEVEKGISCKLLPNQICFNEVFLNQIREESAQKPWKFFFDFDFTLYDLYNFQKVHEGTISYSEVINIALIEECKKFSDYSQCDNEYYIVTARGENADLIYEAHEHLKNFSLQKIIAFIETHCSIKFTHIIYGGEDQETLRANPPKPNQKASQIKEILGHDPYAQAVFFDDNRNIVESAKNVLRDYQKVFIMQMSYIIPTLTRHQKFDLCGGSRRGLQFFDNNGRSGSPGQPYDAYPILREFNQEFKN